MRCANLADNHVDSDISSSLSNGKSNYSRMLFMEDEMPGTGVSVHPRRNIGVRCPRLKAPDLVSHPANQLYSREPSTPLPT